MKIPKRLHLIVLYFAVAGLLGCASMWKAIRSAAVPAGGAALGVVAGSPAGPAGMIAGGAIGAGAAHTINENASLRSGELQGDGAGDREIERLRDLLSLERGARKTAEVATDWFKFWAWRVGAFLALYLLWRNREHIGTIFGRGHAFVDRVAALGHATVGTKLPLDTPRRKP